MVVRENRQFAQKHESGAKPDKLIKEEILKHSVDGKLPCIVAFQIAANLSVPPDDVGKTVDLINFRLAKCQLGLYGYQPEKRKVTPKMPSDPALKNAIIDSLINGKLPCKKAWEIASSFNIHKLTVSCACEALNIKITKCQLGAF